jgi:hypothetical protein
LILRKRTRKGTAGIKAEQVAKVQEYKKAKAQGNK